MTSVQQAYNSLVGSALGAATVGTYMYRQSDTFKAKAEETKAKKISKTISGDKEDYSEMTPAEREATVSRGKEAVAAREAAAKIKPTEKRYENLQKSHAALQKLEGYAEAGEAEYQSELAWEEEQLARHAEAAAIEEGILPEPKWEEGFPEAPTQKEIAEAAGTQRVEERTLTARNMLEALAERKDLLSAKERGQLTTMLGRHKEKGGMDE